jgi:homoserine kinase type II
MSGDLWAILERFPEAARPLDPPEPLGGAGGLSGSRLWRFRSRLGLLLARCWPPAGPPRAALEQVHGWLIEAADLGFLPVPLRATDGRTLHKWHGRLWEVVPWLAGQPETAARPRPGRVRSAFAALASFHGRLAGHSTDGPSPGLEARLVEVTELIDGGFAAFRRALAGWPRDRPLELTHRWLELAPGIALGVVERLKCAAQVRLRRQPCLRDARPEHFLFWEDEVSGLVDFGAMGVDTVATDLARLSSEWLGEDQSLRQEALSAYARVRGLDTTELALIPIFEEASDLLIAAHWARWWLLEGQTFDDPLAVTRGLEKGVGRVLRLARVGGLVVPGGADSNRSRTGESTGHPTETTR